MTFGVPGEVISVQAMANFRVSAQGAGATARDIGQSQIEGGDFFEHGGIGETALNAGGVCSEAAAKLFETRRAGLAGNDTGVRIARGKDESLSARRRAGIDDAFHFLDEIFGEVRGDLSDQLRAFILNAHSVFKKSRRGRDIAGEDGSSAGEQFARGELDGGLGEFGFYFGIFDAQGQAGLGLAVAADDAGRLKAVKVDPALDDPGGMGFGECEFGRRLLKEVNGRSARELAEDGVDHAGGEAMAGLNGQLNALADGGVGGNAVEQEKLKGAETESYKDFGIEFGIGTLEERSKLVVEANLPAEDAEDESCDEIAVGGRESVYGVAAEQIAGVGWSALDSQENLKRCSAGWRYGGHSTQPKRAPGASGTPRRNSGAARRFLPSIWISTSSSQVLAAQAAKRRWFSTQVLPGSARTD